MIHANIEKVYLCRKQTTGGNRQMVKVFEGGAYLVNGTQLIPEGPEALAAVKDRKSVV